LRQIQNEFGSWKGMLPQTITQNEAKTLDILSWGAYLSTLESGKIPRHYGLDSIAIEDYIRQLRERNILTIQYIPTPKDLISLLMIAEGSERKIHSLARSFIKHTPSATVMSSKKKQSVIIFSRLPEENVASVVNSLPSIALENDVRIRYMPLSSFVGYRHNLYQRLLQDDAKWNDDTSRMLTQVRLPPSKD
jgi:hypothetical protein